MPTKSANPHADHAGWRTSDIVSDTGQRQERLCELRNHLERVSWETYIKIKESNRETDLEDAMPHGKTERQKSKRDQ